MKNFFEFIVGTIIIVAIGATLGFAYKGCEANQKEKQQRIWRDQMIELQKEI